MSAGRLEQTFYQTDDGEVCNARVQPETIAATFGGTANDPPMGPATQLASANISTNRRGNGVFARYVRVRWDDGAIPTGYDSPTINVHILSNAAYAAATLGAAVAYLGGTGVVTSRVDEEIG
jgi:hypothetical protein